MYGVPFIICRRIASILADSTRYSLSLPQRETILGRSWLFQKSEFQPSFPNSVCHLLKTSFNFGISSGIKSHLVFPSASSKPICSNWNTIESSLLAGLEYCFAISGVAPQVSPTVSRFLSPKVA